MYKECKIACLPTNQKASPKGSIVRGTLLPEKQKLLVTIRDREYLTTAWQQYHLYVLSDDEIQEGDLVMYTGKCMTKSYGYAIANSIYYADSQSVTGGWYFRDGKTKEESNTFINHYDGTKEVKKIIASTDPALNLPSPSKAFVQKYCEMNGDISKVLVEYDHITSYKTEDGWCDADYHQLKISSDNTITIKKVEEKTYTESEVIRLAKMAHGCGMNAQYFSGVSLFSVEQFIKENL